MPSPKRSPRRAAKSPSVAYRTKRPASPTAPARPAPAAAADKKADGLKGDYFALALLMVLYTLQGVPMGLSGSVPFLMQAKGISMVQQSQFSVVSWPFSFKLIWAPLVDSIYSGRLGRRKTWIVPAQTLIGLLLLWASTRIDVWLGEGGEEPDVGTLTLLFLGFYFLAATQDIAVDGLALTILSERNKELGATCNAIGQSVGFFLAYTGFLAFYSPDFCNSYIRAAADASPVGMVTLGGFMAFWGYGFLASTLWVAVAPGDEHAPLNGSVTSVLTAAYKEMVAVLKLPAVRSLALVLLTAKAALSVFDAVTPLRLVEAGVPREHLALMSSLLFPLGLAAQLYVSGKYFAGDGSQPLALWFRCYPARLILGVASLVLVILLPSYAGSADGLPSWVYAYMLVAAGVATVFSSTMFVSQMAFYSRVSDPAIGGTYMTMLNTVSNLGSAWPTTAALFVVGKATVKTCVARACDGGKRGGIPLLRWAKSRLRKGKDCGCDDVTLVDGYIITCVACLLLGVAWYLSMRGRIGALQALPQKAWLATKKRGEAKAVYSAPAEPARASPARKRASPARKRA